MHVSFDLMAGKELQIPHSIQPRFQLISRIHGDAWVAKICDRQISAILALRKFHFSTTIVHFLAPWWGNPILTIALKDSNKEMSFERVALITEIQD